VATKPGNQVAAIGPWARGRLGRGRGPALLFGRVYEDPAVELGLIPPASRVLCIASAGDTASALARAGHDVTAVDINPVQLAYCRARLAGAPALIGSAERLLAVGRRAAALTAGPGWRPAALERRLQLGEPGWEDVLEGRRLRLLMAAALRPATLALAVVGPLRGLLPLRFDVVLRRRLVRGLRAFPSADNPWAWRLLLGRERPGLMDDVPLPDPTVVQLVQADVLDLLERTPRGGYDAIALSNVLDGPGPVFAARLRAAAIRAVVPEGPVLLRSIREPVNAEQDAAAARDRSMLWGSVEILRGTP